MMKNSALISGLFVAALLASCKPESPVYPFEPEVRSVSWQSDTVELAAGGGTDLEFTVVEGAAVFNYDILSGDCAVYLSSVIGGGVPENFKITGIRRKEEGKGVYVATLTDLKVSSSYSESVRIAVKKSVSGKNSTSVLSNNSVTVRSKGYVDKPTTFTGLPVVYVDTENNQGILSKETWVNATLSIDGAGDYDDFGETACSIRGHGNTTWSWAKKPYAIKFDSKTSVLGMKKGKRWILLANFMDRTLMRNAIAYDCGQQTSLDWTPHYRYCELMLNGKHEGNYMIIEQVRVDKNRVNVTEMEQSDGAEPEISGGYLFELDFHFDNDIQWHTRHGIPFSIKYPDSDEVTSAQVQWAKDYIAGVEDIIYGKDYLDAAAGYKNYIDLQSFVDYWLIYELTINHELANPGSVYFHKDRGGKLVAGPIWDFDWGPFGYSCSPQARGKLFMTEAIWYSRLTGDPEFRDMARKRWAVLMPKFQKVAENFEKYRKYLSTSAGLNFKMWNPADDSSQNGGHIINGDENMSFDAAVTQAKSIFEERISTMNSVLASW